VFFFALSFFFSVFGALAGTSSGRQEEGDTGDWERREEIFFEEREEREKRWSLVPQKKKKGRECPRVEYVACRRRPSSGARWDQSSRSW